MISLTEIISPIAMTTFTLAAINWHSFYFLLFSLIACLFALAMLFSSNIVRMAFYLVISLGATAGLFFLAGAHFVGAMQLMIYVGGTLLLLIFGVMLTAQERFVSMKTGGGEWVLASIVGGSLLAVLLAAALNVESWRHPEPGLTEKIAQTDVYTTTQIGLGFVGARVDQLREENETLRKGMSGYLLPFEIVSVHLLVVLIGAAYLARTKAVVPGLGPTGGDAFTDDKHRPLVVSAALIIGVVAHASYAIISFIMADRIRELFPELARADWLLPTLGAACVIDAVLLLIIFAWQRWAFYGLIVMSFLEAVMLLIAGAGTFFAVSLLIAALIGIAILGALLKFGGEHSAWAQME